MSNYSFDMFRVPFLHLNVEDWEHKKIKLKDIQEFGYYTFFSEYPGFFVYGLSEKKSGSIAIEHGF